MERFRGKKRSVQDRLGFTDPRKRGKSLTGLKRPLHAVILLSDILVGCNDRLSATSC